MKLSLYATRVHEPAGRTRSATGASVYAFDVMLVDPLVYVADCEHEQAATTFAVQGRRLPLRPCPLLPQAGTLPLMCARTVDCAWRGAEAQETANGLACPQCGARVVATHARDRLGVVEVTSCPQCQFAGGVSIGTEEDREKVRQAFALQLKGEDFSAFPELCSDDRDVRAWEIQWDRTRVEGEG